MNAAALMQGLSPRLDDLMRYHRASQNLLSTLHQTVAQVLPANKPGWLSHACTAARCATDSSTMQRIERWMQHRLDGLPTSVLWSWQPSPSKQVQISKTAILKTAAPGEKGVVFISFESQWQKLLALGPERLAAFAEDYDLVLAPTWSPPHSPVNLVFPRLFPGPLPCTISNLADMGILPRLHTSYRPVQLFASSWVNPALYQPRPHEDRDIDLVMVANFGHYKRHHVLFAALARMPQGQRPKVTLIGQPHGQRTVEVLQREMDAYGVRDCITLRSRISDVEVVDTLCRSKTALIASLREGSCVAVVEAMIANTPVALLEGAHIGSSAFLNEHTGRWLNERRLHTELPTFITESGGYSPRSWLLDHGVHCHASTEILNSALKAVALEAGRPWTRNLFEHHWRPDPILLNTKDRQASALERQDIEQRWGLSLA